MISPRKVLATVGFSAVAGKLTPQAMHAQSLPVRGVTNDFKEDLFYREDWLSEPWRKPEPVVLIHATMNPAWSGTLGCRVWGRNIA
jgi:hypothetical protein